MTLEMDGMKAEGTPFELAQFLMEMSRLQNQQAREVEVRVPYKH